MDRLLKVLTVTEIFIERVWCRFAGGRSAFRPVDADLCVVLRPRMFILNWKMETTDLTDDESVMDLMVFTR